MVIFIRWKNFNNTNKSPKQAAVKKGKLPFKGDERFII